MNCGEMSHHVSHWSRFVTSRLASHAAAAASSNPPCSLASVRSALRTSRGIAPEAPAMYTWHCGWASNVHSCAAPGGLTMACCT